MSEVLAWLKQKVDIIDKQTEHKDLEKVVRKIILWLLLRPVRVSSGQGPSLIQLSRATDITVALA